MSFFQHQNWSGRESTRASASEEKRANQRGKNAIENWLTFAGPPWPFAAAEAATERRRAAAGAGALDVDDTHEGAVLEGAAAVERCILFRKRREKREEEEDRGGKKWSQGEKRKRRRNFPVAKLFLSHNLSRSLVRRRGLFSFPLLSFSFSSDGIHFVLARAARAGAAARRAEQQQQWSAQGREVRNSFSLRRLSHLSLSLSLLRPVADAL